MRVPRDQMLVILTVIIAVVSTAGVVLDIFVPRNDAQDGRSATMFTAATLSKAGAIETPSQLLVGRGV